MAGKKNAAGVDTGDLLILSFSQKPPIARRGDGEIAGAANAEMMLFGGGR